MATFSRWGKGWREVIGAIVYAACPIIQVAIGSTSPNTTRVFYESPDGNFKYLSLSFNYFISPLN